MADGGILTSDLALEWPSPADSGGTPPAVAALLHEGARVELATGDLARAARLYQAGNGRDYRMMFSITHTSRRVSITVIASWPVRGWKRACVAPPK